VRKLREFDPDLSVEFDRGVGKFVIYQQGRISGKTVAMVIQGDGGHGCGFRQPDDRDLVRLRAVDMHNERARRQLIEGREQELREQPLKEAREAQTEFREASLDDKYQIRSAWQKATGHGKTSRHVQQVLPKPRGKAYD